MKNKKTKSRRNGLVEIVNGLLSMFILAVLAMFGLLLYGAHSFYAESAIKTGATFQVPSGSGLSSIAARLEDQGLISNRWVFQAGTLAQKKDRAIKAGEYRIPQAASMADLLKELTEGKPITYAVTIPEGFSSWQVVERVKSDPNLTGEIKSLPIEGSLLPDTYSYERGEDRTEILNRMQAAQTETLAEIWANRSADLPYETPQELVTMASIVEKETGISSERPEVAAVFVNRLARGMRLQSDPTIIYGITNGQGPLGRGLKKSEIEAETPYNTYVIDGLPVGPIANPGLAAMQAAANPAETKALYFVAKTANPSDGHLFAASYAEHRKNVALYRKAVKEAAAAQVEAEAEAAAAAVRDAIEEEQANAAGEDTSAPSQ